MIFGVSRYLHESSNQYHTIQQNHHPTLSFILPRFIWTLFWCSVHTALYRRHNSNSSQSSLLLSSAETEVQWQSCSSDKGGLLDNKRRQREIRGKRAAMITGSPAWEDDNPERHHLAVWKPREVGLGWQKAAHYAWFQSALLHVWITGCSHAISGSSTQDRTYVKVLW